MLRPHADHRRILMTQCLMVLAHPDDELLFGWPVLFDQSIDKRLLICSSDEHNAERKWCARRRVALAEVCKLLDVPYECLSYSSDFYRLQVRPKNELRGFCEHVRGLLELFPHDFVFTHNPHGEYGHADHRMLFGLVAESVNRGRVMFTDMRIDADWPLTNSADNAIARRLYSTPFGTVCRMSSAHKQLFERCHAIYRKHGCWTWSKEVISQCQLYQL